MFILSSPPILPLSQETRGGGWSLLVFQEGPRVNSNGDSGTGGNN